MKTRNRSRRGAIAPLTALLLVVILGMMAFAIDLAYVSSVQAQLQNSADAAALAGAEQLQGLYVTCYSPGQTATKQQQIFTQATTDTANSTSPIPTAQRVCHSNVVGGVHPQVLTSDVSFSYSDGQNAPVAAQWPGKFPNTVTTVVRRDGTANGTIDLFFARLFGVSSMSLKATASATMYAGEVTSLTPIPKVNAHILPVALDVNVWNTFYTTGKSPDGNIYPGPDGLPELQVYPFATNTPGSSGLLDVGLPQNNAPAFRTWIDDRETPNDIQYLIDNHLVPVSLSAPKNWKCGPGLKSTLLTDFQSVIGEPNLIPLFTPASPLPNYAAASGNGQNATYAIVGFAGVAVSDANGHGNANMNIWIQPMATVDPTAIFTTTSPARPTQPNSLSTVITTFVSAKLSQ
jgi:Flp pilus assembly protein TadG